MQSKKALLYAAAVTATLVAMPAAQAAEEKKMKADENKDGMVSKNAITADTAANYRKIAISRFKEMKDVREKFRELKARGYVVYAEPTLTLLSVSCVSRDQVCRPYYFVTQGATLPQETIPQVTVVGAVISPTTHFGSEDRMVPTDKMVQLQSLLRGTE